MNQINFDELMEREKLNQESFLPWFLQTESAPIVKYTGESRVGLPNGVLGFITGVGFGSSNNILFQWRSAQKEVSLLDLEPVKVTEFTKEEKEMKYPKQFERVEVVENSSLEVIDSGLITVLQPNKFCIKERDSVGKFINERWYDARVHHLKGYRPKNLLVWRDEYESDAKIESIIK